MERTEWLKKIRLQTEALYDRVAPLYWIEYGFYENSTHLQFIEKFLGRLEAGSTILSAACGAGRYDGMLLEAGHSVLGVDQSAEMLRRAREHFPREDFPRLRYEKMGLQEINFQDEFDGVICIDALENIFPEDWLGVVINLQKALKPGGMLYVTVEEGEGDEVREAYAQAKAQGLPVVYGELADKIEDAYQKIMAIEQGQEIPGELAAAATYHYYPSREQVRLWFDQAGLVIEEEGSGEDYTHILARKKVA